jgi:hypothetical protein
MVIRNKNGSYRNIPVKILSGRSIHKYAEEVGL